MFRKAIGYVIYLIFVVALIILVLEVAGRVWIHMKYGVEGKSYGLWKYDSELGSTHRENAYNTHTSTNNWGFRNREDVIESKPKDSMRFIAFGGSTTFGYNLADDETFTHQLQNKLRAVKGWEGAQVLNAGRIACGAGYNLKLMQRLVPKLKPDFVIIYEGINERLDAWLITNAGLSFDDLKGQYGYIPQNKDADRWLKRNSILVRLFDYKIKKFIYELRYQKQEHQVSDEQPKKEQITDYDPWVLNNYEWVLNQMIDFLKSQGAIPIVIKYASVDNPLQQSMADLSSEIALKKQVAVYDMQQQFADYPKPLEDLFIETGVHVTAEGAKIMAKGLFELIKNDRGV